MDKPLSLKQLRRIARRFGISEDPKRGKGSHTFFYRKATPDGETGKGYTVPTSRKTIHICYVRDFRKKFKLTVADGVTDEEFYE